MAQIRLFKMFDFKVKDGGIFRNILFHKLSPY